MAATGARGRPVDRNNRQSTAIVHLQQYSEHKFRHARKHVMPIISSADTRYRIVYEEINMRSLILLAVFILTALTQFAAAQDKTELEKYAERFIAAEDMAWQQGDFSALEAIEDPGIYFHELDLKGWEAHKKYITDGRMQVSGLQQKWAYLTGEGNLFALSYEATGVFNKQKFRTVALMLFRRSNGRITDVWLNLNTTNPDQQGQAQN